MLFHGAAGILKEGFKDFKFGRGVCMTDCSDTARGFTVNFVATLESITFTSQSEKLRTFEFETDYVHGFNMRAPI